MQIIGFNFTRISGERNPEVKGKPTISTNIHFISVKKEKINLLKDAEAFIVSFKLSIAYNQLKEVKKEDSDKIGEIIFEGASVLSIDKNDPKDILKSFKKEEVPKSVREFLLNYVLKKCNVKAFDLEDQLLLPPHVPLPYMRLKKKD